MGLTAPTADKITSVRLLGTILRRDWWEALMARDGAIKYLFNQPERRGW